MGTKEKDEKKMRKICSVVSDTLYLMPFIGKFKCRRKGSRKLEKEATLGGFICFLLISMASAFPAYCVITGLGRLPEGKDTIGFLLYVSIIIGAGIWSLCYFICRNEEDETFQMVMQPFVLVVTLWGYNGDKFGIYKGWMATIATAVLIISYLISLNAYKNRQKKKTVDVTIEKTSTVYEVVLVNGKGIENHYRVTVRK